MDPFLLFISCCIGAVWWRRAERRDRLEEGRKRLGTLGNLAHHVEGPYRR